MSSFWSWFVIILTVATFAGITWILFANRTGAPADPEQKTGHAADGIEEYDNPMPYWWFLMFVITLVFGAAYLIVYPGLGNFQGLLGWSQEQQWQSEVETAEKKYREIRFRYLAMPVEEVAQISDAVKMGQRIYSVNCSVCHGADAKGAYGFPNLTDDAWQWGSSPDAIKYSIVNGRRAAMPAWEAALGDEGLRNMAAYTLRLSGREVNDAHADAAAPRYQALCVACHGPEGKGNPQLGAPNLTNGIWLYGGTQEQVMQSLRNGRNGIMPAFADQLDEDKIHLVTAYVYSLSQ